ncbi:MAG: DNA methyltransferase [Salinibacterium amurskyense]
MTDGRWWGIVSAKAGITTASGVFDALIWREERDSRDAFFALAGFKSLAGIVVETGLPTLFEASVASAEAITEALGDQVRRAVELVLQAMSDSHLRALAVGDDSPLPKDSKEVYEASVSILMRVIFLLFAEERGLLPQHQMYRDSYAIAGVREELTRQAQNDSEESLDHSWETWHRLLATSRAVYSGATFEDARMPAYGGSIFSPTRFPWLRSVDDQGQLRLKVSDRVMLKVLEAVQVAHVGGEARRLSFRDLDVEQIGYVYEGLLGYSAEYTDDVVVGLHGKSGFEPEIGLTELSELASASANGTEFAEKLTAHLKTTQPNSKSATSKQIAKAFDSDDETTAADARTRLGYVLLGQTEIVDQLVPMHALIRNDLRDFPYVVPAGGLVMTESPQRANTGTHYTPRSLAEEVVLHTLEPLVYAPGPLDTETRDEWVLKSSTEILNLKVADIAVGSGAFLVAAARYLADRLIEARSKEGLSTAENDDAKRWAIREVVARCLYGADINGMAVEMCKLSLWLVSMDPGKPFSFVDDRIFHGNSLLGVTTERQLRAQHIDPGHSQLVRSKLLQLDVDRDLEKAAKLRHELSSGQVDDADRMRSTRAKRKLLEESRAVTAKLRDLADGIIAAGLLEGGKPGRSLDTRYDELADALYAAYPPDHSGRDRTRLDKLLLAGLTPSVSTGDKLWKPLHWVIEAPDVIVDRGGFDAIVGNPPFLGGQKLTSAMGDSLRDWLVNVLASGRRGSADLVAYFFLRSGELLAPLSGQIGLIATNTVAQGVTREVGLGAMVNNGLTIRRAIQSARWPARSANLEFAAIWGTVRPPDSKVGVVSDGVRVGGISSLLEPQGLVSGEPVRLRENAAIAFQGVIARGTGFFLTQAEYDNLLEANARNADVLRPYFGGEDLNSTTDASATRYIVDFGGLNELEAKAYQAPWDLLYERVRPIRMALDRNKYPRLITNWWEFEARRPGMYRAISGLSDVITIALVSKTVMPMRVRADQVFANTLGVFALDSYADLAVLSSMPHQTWAIKFGSGMRNDPRYTPSDVFETLPRPRLNERLDQAGLRLHQERGSIMVSRGVGLTSLYNLVNSTDIDDRDICRLREIHVEVDCAVLEAYGWDDITTDHGFYTYRQMERFTVSPAARVEVLDRLLQENQRRAAFEAQNGGKDATNKHVAINPESVPEGAMF